ncbi:MAG: thioredoxin family protein [Ignavibacteriae bacterium]|nr:thioredoxin family protein [Ignavibacteriota bacterium]
METLTSIENVDNFIKDNDGCLIYFSTPQCNVCKILKPKIKEFIDSEFPKIKMGYVDCENQKEAAAQNRVFTVPTILVFFDGKEFIRKSRNINISEFRDEISRPYSLFF